MIVAFAIGRRGFNAQDLALPFHIDILAGRNILQFVGAAASPGTSHTLHRDGLRSPAATVRMFSLRVAAPARISLRAVTASRNHMSCCKLCSSEIDDVRIHAVSVEIHVRFGVARREPCVLHGLR